MISEEQKKLWDDLMMRLPWEELKVRLRQHIVKLSGRIQQLEKEIHEEEDLWEKVHILIEKEIHEEEDLWEKVHILIEKEKHEHEITAYHRTLDTMTHLEEEHE